MNIFFQVLVWQFFEAPREIFKGWRNFLLFNLNYFSIPILLKTFFSPWHKYSYQYSRILEVWNNIQVFVFNMMSRVIGAFLRSVFIIIGILTEILIFVIGAAILVIWFLLPALLLIGFLFGINLIFY